MNHTILTEYRRMRDYGIGGVVGENARQCLRLAKARAQWFERDDIAIEHMPEIERYEDVYGMPAPDGAEFCCVAVRVGGEIRASLGFVETNDSQYLRVVENEMLCEALQGNVS